MRGNWISMSATAAAANSNPTTLSAVSNYPTYADVFGTSGTRLVEYELDDGAGHFEAGTGTITLSTLSLSRDYPAATYDVGATPKYVANSTVRLTAFSAPVNVRCAPLASSFTGTQSSSPTFGTGTPGIGNGYTTINTTNQLESQYTLDGWRIYFPFLWEGNRPINRISMSIITAGLGTVLVGMMECRGSTLNLIANFTSINAFNATVTGMQSLVAPTDFTQIFIPPGPYVLQVVPTGATSPKVYGAGYYASNRCGAFGNNSSNAPYNRMLDSAGATTLATTFSGSPGGGVACMPQVPLITFGVA